MILHICFPSKFLTDFMTFTKGHLSSYKHKFLFVSTEAELKKTDPQTWELLESGGCPFATWFYADQRDVFTRNVRLFRDLYSCRKIVIHGLFLPERITQILCHAPLLASKSFWLMWGGDFYFPERQDPTQARLIRRIGHLVTYVPGDIEYVVQNYHAVGTAIECLGYPSNLFRSVVRTAREDGTVRIQVGNSATRSNQHTEVFEKLSPFQHEDIEIICPLSYGDNTVADRVEKIGKEMFGEKFVSIRNFLPYDKYLTVLESVDIAIFNHDRQQGMGNIITHLGCGHKVYLRSDQSPWRVFRDRGIRVFDILEGVNLEHDLELENRKRVAEHFSIDCLIHQWKTICEM